MSEQKTIYTPLFEKRKGAGRPKIKPDRIGACYNLDIRLIDRLHLLKEQTGMSISDALNEAGHSLCDAYDIPKLDTAVSTRKGSEL